MTTQYPLPHIYNNNNNNNALLHYQSNHDQLKIWSGVHMTVNHKYILRLALYRENQMVTVG